jgi:CubicO group peptidase (beta-lactamase class C family)
MPSMDRIEQLMHGGIRQGVFPGAALLVMAGDAVLFEQAYGWANLFSGRPMTKDTLFDLASLTKPLATALAAMALVRQGRMDLDVPCSKVCPELVGTDKADITPRQLLNHSSGLPPWRPFFMRLRCLPAHSRLAGLRHCMMTEPLESAPGKRSAYSDLGFMLLHWVVEQLAGEAVDTFINRQIFHPLGIEELFYNDSSRVVAEPEKYAATQLCPWRNRLMVGQVDDDNAWISGGVAGHAGLFGTAGAVGRLLAALLAADQSAEGTGVFDPSLVKIFWHTEPDERWALGFDTPSRQDSSAGCHFPADSVGHLGFTGTSFWIHRHTGVIVVLLTNRVHPWRYRAGIKTFRPRLHDAVMAALGSNF